MSNDLECLPPLPGDFTVESAQFGTKRQPERTDADELAEYRRVLNPKRMGQLIAMWRTAERTAEVPDLETLVAWLIRRAE